MEKNPSKFEMLLERKIGAVGAGVVIFFLEIVQIIIISSAIIIPIRYFLIQPFYVKGASMEPNFYDREYLIIDELTFRFREPDRGEVVVFKYPRDTKEYFIKRVIGLPGETIEVSDGHITIYNDAHPNGELLQESYLPPIETPGTKKVTLAKDEYYVLGDNRDSSLDSRGFGPVNQKHLIGRVWVRGLPLSRVASFSNPKYNF